MKSYFTTFPAGCYGIIAKRLKQFKMSELQILEHDESSMVFKSSFTNEKIIEFRFFTNTYLVINEFSRLENAAFKNKYFRVMGLKVAKPVQIETKTRSELELKIIRKYGLTPGSSLSRNDFYLIERQSGNKLFTLKLARAKFKRSSLNAGELKPELANILCLVASLKPKDKMLDMFAGYGSIPYEAVRGFGCKNVIAVDNRKLSNRHEHASIQWYLVDAGKLDFIVSNSIDKIITDPPWGIFEKTNEEQLKTIYFKLLSEAFRVLKPNGIAVILAGNSLLDELIQDINKFKLLKHYSILVSGKKAIIYKLQKV